MYWFMKITGYNRKIDVRSMDRFFLSIDIRVEFFSNSFSSGSIHDLPIALVDSSGKVEIPFFKSGFIGKSEGQKP